jgi:hypothetical protein
MTQTKKIIEQAWLIALDARASRWEKLTALSIICGCRGILLPALDERFLSVRQVTQLRRVQEQLVGKALRRKAARKKQNARAYLRKRLRALEQGNDKQENDGTTATD